MVLEEADELRHRWDSDPNWRESLYFNFADAQHGIGAWLYLWVLPNQPLKSGMLVSFYHGNTTRRDANDIAMVSPGHLYEAAGGRWVYCYNRDLPQLLAADFDDVDLCGLRFRREKPLERYSLSFDDGEGSSFEFDCRFMTRPWDYADGVFPTPAWLAANRYHRCWWVKGRLTIVGRQFDIETTGDSDHSWGTRDRDIFARNKLKTWSMQSPDGRLSMVATEVGKPGQEAFIGYIDLDGEMSALAGVEHTADYAVSGLQHNISIEARDALGRVVRARLGELFGCVGGGSDGALWGFEGAGAYDVEGLGRCTGIATYWWPPFVTAHDLHSGRAETWSGS